MSEEQTTQRDPKSESFSLASAHEAMNEMFDAIPKSRRAMYLGNLNEAAWVIARIGELMGRPKGSDKWFRSL